MFYKSADLIRAAKRENNQKRNYLLVNRLQGKHIPVRPSEALTMFRALADELPDWLCGKRTLVIGFAETATAIGAVVAERLGACYIQTTRETAAGAQYLYFSEEHSHAVGQRLIKQDLDQVMPEIDDIVFVEDEVTTGNTILNLVNVLDNQYGKRMSYTVASLVNGMGETEARRCENRAIRMYYLAKTDNAGYAQAVQLYQKKGTYFSMMHKAANEIERTVRIESLEADGWLDARRLVQAGDYAQACRRLWEQIDSWMHIKIAGKILVLGTEEFMYPALYAAEQMEKKGAEIWFHATTRSPIEVYEEELYPLHVRYELPSVYEKSRKTFVYDIGSYDLVLIVTDSHNEEKEGLEALIRAVSVKNKNIDIVRWC